MRLLALVCLVACSANTGSSSDPDGGAGGDGSTGDATCGGTALDLTYVPPPFVVVLDRSCSMRQTVPAAQKTRWTVAIEALTAALGIHANDLAFGLTLFPDTSGEACSQDAIPITAAPGTAGAISAMLTAALATTDPLYPDDPCVTNIDTAMQQAAMDPALAGSGPRYIMLVTDGAQSGNPDNPRTANNCTGNAADPVTAQTIGALQADGVTTFVVGFGGDVDATALNLFARRGGAPLAGTTKYYAAEDPTQLAAAFSSIVAQAVSCEYAVNPAPPDVDKTYVWFGGTELVDRDTAHTAGWDYDPATMTLTFYGAACDRLKTRAVTDIDVVFGCPTPPIL